MSGRRFHEEGAGGRTGLRLPAVSRNAHGMEDVSQFFQESNTRMEQRGKLTGAQLEEYEDDDEEDYDDDDDFNNDINTRDEDGPDRHSGDEYADSLVEHQLGGSEDGEGESEDNAVEDQIASGLQKSSASRASKSRSSGATGQGSTSMDLENSDAPSPHTAVRSAQNSARRTREPTPSFLAYSTEDSADDNDNSRARTPRQSMAGASIARSTPGMDTIGDGRRHDARASSRISTASGRALNFDSTLGGEASKSYGAEGSASYMGSGGAADVLPFDDGVNSSPALGTDGGRAERSLDFSDGAPTPTSRRQSSVGRSRADADEEGVEGVEGEEEAPAVKRPGRKSGSSAGGRSSNASASRSSLGSANNLAANMGRRAFKLRHTNSLTPNRSAETSSRMQDDGEEEPPSSPPSRANMSDSQQEQHPSPAKSAVSSVPSSAGGRALDFNDYGDDDDGDDGGGYNDMGGGYDDGPGYDDAEDVGEDDQDGDRTATREVLIERDVGEEALRGTSAGRADLELVSPRGTKAAAAAAAAKNKKDPKGKRRARSDEAENDNPDGGGAQGIRGVEVHVDKRIIQRGGANDGRKPLAQQRQQVEIVERIPDEYHLRGMGDPDQTIEQPGPRRGKRLRFAPLEWWRGERAIFGRPRLPAVPEAGESDEDEDDEDEDHHEDEFEARPRRQQFILPVPVLKEVVRVPRAPGEGTFSGMRVRRKGPRGRKKSRAAKDSSVSPKKRKAGGSDSDEESEDGDTGIRFDARGFTRQPEDGWDEETDQMGLVWDVDAREETTRRIACQRSQVKTLKVFNSDFKFQKVFGVDEFMAAGVIELPIGGSKPVKPSKTNSYAFVVTEGAVRVRVHRSNFVMGPGGMFLVPKGNTYSIENIAKRESRLFFAQARDPNLDPEQARGAMAMAGAGGVGNVSQSFVGNGSVPKGGGGRSPAKRAKR